LGYQTKHTNKSKLLNFLKIFIQHFESERQLKSSSIIREDRILLEQGNRESAQLAKEKLEELQRYDRKLREKYHKNHK
jgi:hypothetical protein